MVLILQLVSTVVLFLAAIGVVIVVVGLIFLARNNGGLRPHKYKISGKGGDSRG